MSWIPDVKSTRVSQLELRRIPTTIGREMDNYLSWVLIPISIAIVCVTVVGMRCLRKHKATMNIKGMGIEITITSGNQGDEE